MEENYDATWYLSDDAPLYIGGYGYGRAGRDSIIWSEYTKRKPPYKLAYPKEKPMPTDQDQIDDEVRKAIAKPRREAQIAMRLAAVETLGAMLENADDGTVLRFKRTYGSKTYNYAALKVDGKWHLTGSMSVSSGITDDGFLEWMTTGESIVFDVQIATAWDTVL